MASFRFYLGLTGGAAGPCYPGVIPKPPNRFEAAGENEANCDFIDVSGDQRGADRTVSP
jgi:hypothetical protein